MLPPLATRRLLVQVALACMGIGMLAFAAMDLLWARLSYLNLETARDATPHASWRSGAAPLLPLSSLLDLVGVAGLILLVVMMISRSLPAESRRQAHLAIGILALGVIVSVGRNIVGRSHDHEGAWGALQLGIVSLALVVLVWRVIPARFVALAGAAVFTLRQPMIWRASDEYVRASGDAAAAYGAELAKLAAHTVGATGALLLAIALFLAATRAPWKEPIAPAPAPPRVSKA